MDQRSNEIRRREERRDQVDVPKVSKPPVEEPEKERRPPSSTYSAQNKSEEQIRSDIERTRAEMTETVDSIQEHIAPKRLRKEAQQAIEEATVGRARQMVSRVRNRAQGVRQDFVQAVRENPIPAAMIALGLGWLLREVMSQDSEQVRVPEMRGRYEQRPMSREMERRAERTAEEMQRQAQKPRQMAGEVQERASHMATEARERASHTMEEARSRLGEAQSRAMEAREDIQERAEEWMGQAQRRFRRTSSQIGQFIENNPLAAGAIALTAGALIGLAVPESEQENEWLGETRDRMMHRAQEAAEGTVRRTSERAEGAVRTAEHMMGEAEKTMREEGRGQPSQK
jgi:ElaB/YqjD/DUF883 family membrane-anchored ribosome-binding protein